MRFDILIFLLVVGLSLLWKYRREGVSWVPQEGLLGNGVGKRLILFALLGAIGVGLWLVAPEVFFWTHQNKGVSALVLVVLVVWFLWKPPKSSPFGYVLGIIVLWGVYNSISPQKGGLAEVTKPVVAWWNEWWEEKPPSTTKTPKTPLSLPPAPKEAGGETAKPLKTPKTMTQVIVGERGGFKRVKFHGAAIVESVSWKCPAGCLVGIQHAIMQGDAPLCGDGFYGEIPCTARVIPGRDGERRLEEIFTFGAAVPGESTVDLGGLHNFILAFSSEGDPVEVFLTTIVSN